MRSPLPTVASVLAVALLLGCGTGAGREGEETYDLLLLGGTVIDGSGGDRFAADVGIRDGEIVAVGDLEGAVARERLDVSGRIVAPGFIDTHSHADRGLVDPALRQNAGFLTQGVTTSLFGLDGAYAPSELRRLSEIFARQGVGTNYGFFVGHNGIRREVLGMANRPPDAEELAAMERLVAEGMDMGAFGFSTGLMYLPGHFADTDEVVALAKVAAAVGGVYDSHIRDPAGDLVASVAEALEIGAAAGAHAHPAHHKAPGMKNFGKGEELSALIAAAIARGQAVTVDQYPYDGAATAKLIEVLVAPGDVGLGELHQRFAAADASEEERDALLQEASDLLLEALADPPTRARIRELTETPPDDVYSWVETVGYDSFRLVVSDAHPDWTGRMIVDIAADEGVSPFDLLARLIADDGAVAKITLGACLEDDVRTILTRPWTMVASDGAITGFEGGGGHPRSRGTFPRVLGRYVREWGVLTLEEAVHKMTGLPADYLGLEDRGRIEVGRRADVTVFDPETVIDRATWREPSLLSAGIEHVFVNGNFALRDGEVTGECPGEPLRRTRTRPPGSPS
ncbi:MAG: amidohydrolase family protein [Thermoanaerobaculia bacterium]|nr:amidohydrolase family protein [Thermoanaerobaculia bacterium]